MVLMFFTLSEHVVENIIGEYKKPIQPMHLIILTLKISSQALKKI